MLLDHPCIAKFLATTISGTSFITARLAHVCRKPWKDIRGLILARSHASIIGRAWSDLRNGSPLARRSSSSWPPLPVWCARVLVMYLRCESHQLTAPGCRLAGVDVQRVKAADLAGWNADQVTRIYPP
jgi:hypothetical protein